MSKKETIDNYEALLKKLKIDCEKCSGLCCVALFCAKIDGFPMNKNAGVPCKHLQSDFRCNIHSNLAEKNMRGCLAYDCFGAGQKVTQKCYPNIDWKSDPLKAEEIFQVFMVVFQLHQMEWYLIESLCLSSAQEQKKEIEQLIAENEEMTAKCSQEILNLDISGYKERINQLLKKVSESITTNHSENHGAKDFLGKNFKKANLYGKDFSMSLMIATNLEGCNLQHVNFLGADLRDANIKNTDLSECFFLTQMQLNSADGNIYTKIPKNLSRPVSWQRVQ